MKLYNKKIYKPQQVYSNYKTFKVCQLYSHLSYFAAKQINTHSYGLLQCYDIYMNLYLIFQYKKKAQDINKSTLLVNCFMYKKNIDKMTCMIIEFHCSLSIKELQFGQHLHILSSRCNEKPVAFAANNTNTITLQKLKSSIFKMLQLKRHKHEQQMIWWSFQ